MKVALLGAGHIGQTIAQLLHASGDFALTVFDRDQAALDRLAQKGIRTMCIDTSSAAELTSALDGHLAVVNALPYHLAISAAQAALRRAPERYC